MDKYCKLSDYAKKFGVTYRTAFNRFKAGKIKGAFQNEGDDNHILVPIEYLSSPVSTDVVIYATVTGTKDDDMEKLEEQVQTMTQFCNARGYRVERVVKEAGISNIIGERPKFMELLKDRNCKHIVVEKPTSVSRWGYQYIETLLETDHRQIEAMNNLEPTREETTNDFVKTIYYICKNIGGKRLPKKYIRALINKLVIDADDEIIDEL